jgi:ABC-2 type transport system permease protein
VAAITALLAGYGLLDLVERLNTGRTDAPITEIFFADSILFWLILILITPVITMRSFASEKSQGTYEALMTAPVGDWQVVFAKYVGAMLFYLSAWIPFVAVLVALRQATGEADLLDPRAAAGALLGIGCVGSSFIAMGVFASALTRSQVIAAMTSLLLGAGLWAASLRPSIGNTSGDRVGLLLDQVSVTRHMQDFARGVVDARALAFHAGCTALFLFLTQRVVETRRWK